MNKIEEIVQQLRGEQNDANDTFEKHFSCMIAQENDALFAFSVFSLVETIELNKKNEIVPVPLVDPYILGVANIRGEMVPVLSLREMLGESSGNQRYIVVVENEFKVGFAFSEIVEILDVVREDIIPINAYDDSVADQFIKEEFEYQGSPVRVIDIDGLYQSSFIQ